MPDAIRTQQSRAVVSAFVVCALSLGILLGHFLKHESHPVMAGTHDIPTELATAFVQIARRVEPSVVNISTVAQLPGSAGRERTSSADGQTPYEPSRPVEREVRRGNGSGVIVDDSGFILTNHHVIVGADRIKVKLFDGSEYSARLVGSDQDTDLAVIKIEPKNQLQNARLGDSERTQVGDWVLAIGSPFGLDQTVTAGIISAKDREAAELRNRPSFQHFLQTDAAINRGNSGGPLINLAGEVIGINAAIATSTGDYNGIGFAIPSEEAIQIYRQLSRGGRVKRGFLGIITDPVTPQIAKVYGVQPSRGAIISIVTDSYRVDGREVPTPAVRAGLRLGDVVTQYRGDAIRSNLDLVRRVAGTPVGTEVELKVTRNGQDLTLRTTVGMRPGSDTSREPGIIPDAAAETATLGLDVANLPASAAKELDIQGISGVVVVRVEPGSPADDAELRRDDIIEEFNRQPVSTAIQFRRALDRLGSAQPIVLQVYRRKAGAPRRFVSLTNP
ncbi:MAG: Do family serine endopeptidase [Acidobacteriota bacterium]